MGIKFVSNLSFENRIITLMHNVPKWSDTRYKNLAANVARFLKCV